MNKLSAEQQFHIEPNMNICISQTSGSTVGLGRGPSSESLRGGYYMFSGGQRKFVAWHDSGVREIAAASQDAGEDG